MKNILAIIALLIISVQVQAQVLRTRSQCQPALSSSELFHRAGQPASFEDYPNGMDTIMAYHSLDRPLPPDVDRMQRTGLLVEVLLPYAEVVNTHFDHLGSELVPVCLPKGTPVLCVPYSQDMMQIKYILTCGNVSQGFVPIKVKIVYKDRTFKHSERHDTLQQIPGETQVITNYNDTTTSRVLLTQVSDVNHQAPRSAETQHYAGSATFTCYQQQRIAINNNVTANGGAGGNATATGGNATATGGNATSTSTSTASSNQTQGQGQSTTVTPTSVVPTTPVNPPGQPTPTVPACPVPAVPTAPVPVLPKPTTPTNATGQDGAGTIGNGGIYPPDTHPSDPGQVGTINENGS